MKKYLFIAAVLFTVSLSAQNLQPKLEAFGQMVKATYYYDNGQIQQEGFFKNGKLEGQWVAYDENGIKKSIAEYTNGVKSGKWVFWNDAMLSEVNYKDSRIASVKNWKQDALANRN